MWCVENCPTGSIRFDNNQFEFLSSCTSCMRCYNFCPNYAIEIDNTYADPETYKRYRGPQNM